VESVIDADPVAAAVRDVMATKTAWKGTASDLMSALGEMTGERVSKSKAWPDGPRALAGRLRRAATFLRKIGIGIEFVREGRERTRAILITKLPSSSVPESAGVRPSALAASSVPSPKANIVNGFMPSRLRMVAKDADGRTDGSGIEPAAPVRANPFKSNSETAADGTDANIPHQSTPPRPFVNAVIDPVIKLDAETRS
jgi:hypothetical protein